MRSSNSTRSSIPVRVFRSVRNIAGAGLVATISSAAAIAGDGVILQAATVGCTQGQVAEVQVRATTVGLVGGFGFNASTAPLTASDVRYDGPIFETSWQGWDSAPSSNTRVDAVCVFTEDQVEPGDHNLVTIEVAIPADMPAGTVIPVTLANVQFFNYDFSVPSLDPQDGRITVFRTADLDGDGTVGSGDLGMLLAAWGKAPTGTPADLDADGHVNGEDLGRLVDRWSTEG